MEENKKRKRILTVGGIAIGAAAASALFAIASSNVASPPVCVYGPPPGLEREMRLQRIADEAAETLRGLIAKEAKISKAKLNDDMLIREQLHLSAKKRARIRKTMEARYKIAIPASEWNSAVSVSDFIIILQAEINNKR